MILDLPPDSPLRQGPDDRPTLVILLRSFGCTFCREAMADVAAARAEIDALAQVAFVHGEPPAEAEPWFRKFGLEDVIQVSDPELAHYRAFGLGRTTAGALVAPAIWTRGAVCALSHGFGAQPPRMLRQLPGVFVVHRDRVVAEYRHRSPADRPDYLALARAAATALQ